MAGTLAEADCKLFRRRQPAALDRFCQRVPDDDGRPAGEPGRSPHDRYLAVYRLVRDRGRARARAAAFDRTTRSTGLVQLARLRAEGLLTDGELAGFSPEARSAIAALVAARPG